MAISKHRHNVQKFIEQLDTEDFYAAHETLETIWFPRRFEECDEIKLLKGFINAAVSFELVKKGRPEQAKKVWKNYLKYKPLLQIIDSDYLHDYHSMAIHIEKTKDKLDIN